MSEPININTVFFLLLYRRIICSDLFSIILNFWLIGNNQYSEILVRSTISVHKFLFFDDCYGFKKLVINSCELFLIAFTKQFSMKDVVKAVIAALGLQ